MSQKTWYLFKDNHHIGPFSIQEIKDRFDRGEIGSNIPVWREGEQEWIPLANQTELASHVMPMESVELPPLPPLPDEAFDNELPGQPDQLTAAPDSQDPMTSQEPVEPLSETLEDRLKELEEELPHDSVDAESFWQVDNPGGSIEETGIPDEFVDKSAEVTNTENGKQQPANLKMSLQDKLTAVRSKLGDNVEAEKTSTYEDGDVRFIKEEVPEEDFSTDDPIRSDQKFDGDDDLPDFMSENSVDYLTGYANGDANNNTNNNEEILRTEPDEGELAAIQASGNFSDELSEELPGDLPTEPEEPKEEPVEISEEINEPKTLETANAEPYVDPKEVQEIKAQAEEVEDLPEEELEQLQEETFLPESYEDELVQDQEYDEYYEEDEEAGDYEDVEGEFDEFEAPKESAGKFWLKIVAALVVVAILGVSASQLFHQKKKIPSLTKLSKQDARTFRETIQGPSDKFRYQFAVSDNSAMNIWFATNIPDQGLLDIRLESREKKVKSRQKIVATAQTEVLSYVGRFKEVRLIEGDQLAEGEYRVIGTFKVGGSKSRVIQWLKKNTPLAKMKYFKYKLETYKLDGTFYYSQKKGSQLKEEVSKYWLGVKEEKSKPLLVELQKWRTLKTLSENVVDLFKQALNVQKTTIKKVGESFQKDYAKVIAPVFQTLTLDTQALIQDDKKLLPSQVTRLEKLLDLQKAFGSNVAANLDSLNKYKKLTKSIKAELADVAAKRQVKFSAKVDDKILELQQQLSQIE